MSSFVQGCRESSMFELRNKASIVLSLSLLCTLGFYCSCAKTGMFLVGDTSVNHEAIVLDFPYLGNKAFTCFSFKMVHV